MSSPPSSASSEPPIPTAEHTLHEAPSVCTSEQPAVGGKELDLLAFSSQLPLSLDDQELLERSIADPELMRAEAAALRALAASKTQMWPPDSLEPDYGLDEEYKGNVSQYDDLTIVEEPRTPDRHRARKERPRAPSLRSIEDDLMLQMVVWMSAREGKQSLRQQAHDRLLFYGALSAMHGSAGSEAATPPRALASRPPQASPSKLSTASLAGAPPKPSSHAPSESRSLIRKMKQRLRQLTSIRLHKLTSIDLQEPTITPQKQRGRVETGSSATQADPAPQMRQ